MRAGLIDVGLCGIDGDLRVADRTLRREVIPCPLVEELTVGVQIDPQVGNPCLSMRMMMQRKWLLPNGSPEPVILTNVASRSRGRITSEAISSSLACCALFTRMETTRQDGQDRL